MNSYDTALEAAAKAYAEATGYYVPFHAGLSSDSSDSIRKGVSAAISAYISTLSPDVSGLAERLKYEAEAMRLAPSANGEDFGDTLHASNWADKPHRVLFDAVELIKQSADALTALSLQLGAVE